MTTQITLTNRYRDTHITCGHCGNQEAIVTDIVDRAERVAECTHCGLKILYRHGHEVAKENRSTVLVEGRDAR